MSRILFDGEWYDELAGSALYETDYESIVLQESCHLYPDYLAVEFKTLVSSPDRAAKADFALVAQDYRDWWVVEVEMGHHDFERHVIPQVRTLASASYGAREAEYLCERAPNLSRRAILDMMKGRQPRVLVVIDSAQLDWADKLRRYDAALAIIQVFRSDRNRYVYRINGERPRRPAGVLTRCRLDPTLPRLLQVESPASLAIGRGARIKMRYENGLTEWERMDAQNKVWLNPVSANPLKPGVEYVIMQHDDCTFEIQQSPHFAGRRKTNGNGA